MNKLTILLCFAFLGQSLAQSDVEKDVKTGAAVAQKVEKQIGIVPLETAAKAVTQVGDRLVAQLTSNPYKFSFQIIDQPEPNAFALPGGFIFVSRGLLVLLKNEDELAGVLGHEISHVIRRHSAKSQKKAILPTLLAAPGVIVGGTVGGELGDKIAAPLLGAGKLYLASFSRKQEAEADNLGIELAAKAGYQPAMLADILNRMEKSIQAESGKASTFSFFSDHPKTPDRMTAIASKSASLTPSTQKSNLSDFEFLSAFNHLPYGPNPIHGVFNENIFLHPKLNVYMTFPKGWTCFNETSAAGGFSEDKKEVAAMMIAGKDRQLDTLIERFVNRYYANTRMQPISDKHIDMGGRDGSEVILPGQKKGDILYTLWFRKDGHTFVILGSGSASSETTFREIGKSFRDLNKPDYTLIHDDELKTVKVNKGETLQAVAARAGNVMDPKLTAIINDIAENTSPKENGPFKVIVRKPFEPVP